MKLLDRYIFRQFAVSFLFASLTFAALFTLIDMVENLDGFFDRKAGPAGIAWYYLVSLPGIFQVTAPVSALLASILTAGRLSASSELAAIRSSGISLDQLMRPFLLGGIIIALANLTNASLFEPVAASAKIAFQRDALNKTRPGLHEGTNIHILEPDSRVVTIGSFDPEGSRALNVTIERFDGPHLLSRTDGPVMVFDGGLKKWVMPKAAVRIFGGADGRIAFRAERDTLDLALTVESLKELNVLPEEMNLVQHYRYIKEKMQAGFPGLERAQVKLHAKLAMPLSSLIVILIGVPLSAVKKRSGLAGEIALALFIGFLFLGMQRTVATMGYNAVIEPWVAAWLPLLLFLGAGVFLYRKALA
ncbi:MAG: LptF/LptG family permease [Chlorobium sp.]|uniref:LptF/LptG family permease n=1 Tax=Chlorobium sp. TaxID=1095 RepID=UPI0025C1A4E9|nr:LptF/LptG family permease [Chlorobium sp.]MCF8382498.1 LptF/LptG family permease [Chlorobium sp.]